MGQGMFWKLVLDEGLGMFSKIKVWQDKWIPTPTTFKVVSPRNILPKEATVSVLFNSTNHSWKENLNNEVFLSQEADMIRRIRLGSSLMEEDKLIWHYDLKGRFICSKCVSYRF